MKIQFSDVYRDMFSGFVTKNKVSDTMRRPDKHLSEQLDDQHYEFFARRFTKTGRVTRPDYYVWVMCLVTEGMYDVNTALVIPTALDKDLGAMNPKQMLSSLLEEVGLVIRTQDKAANLIYHETFWHKGSDPARIFEVQTPQGAHSCISGWWRWETHGSAIRVQCHLVFALDLTKYRGWLKSLGL